MAGEKVRIHATWVLGLRQCFRFRRSNRHARAVDLDNDAARYGRPWFRGASADKVRARDWKKGVRVQLVVGAPSPCQNCSFLTDRYRGRRPIQLALSACPRTRSVETVQLIVLCCASCPTNLQPGSFHKPAIVRLAASKSLAQFDISLAALRLQPTNPWLLGDSSVYFRSWKSGLSRLRSGETEPCARRCAFNQIGEIDRGDFFYLNRP